MKSQKSKAAFRCTTVIVSALLVFASLSMAGCSLRSLIPNRNPQSDDTNVVQPENTDQNNSQEEPPNEEPNQGDKPVVPSYYNPLTGLASESDLSFARPVAICIGSTAGALSDFGLRDAEMVIEAPVENGETRLTLITATYAGAKQLGAVGITRPYLQAFGSFFGAVSVCAGTDDRLQSTGATVFPSIDYARDGLSTVFFKTEEHGDRLFTSGTRLIGALENFEKIGATLPYQLVPYAESVTYSGGQANGVVIPYSGAYVTQFSYDNAKQMYICTQNAAMRSENAEQTLSFKNLLLFTCESSVHHKVTGTEFELNTQSGGSGYYVTNGSYTEIQWTTDETGKLLITDSQGDLLTVNRGNTYIGLVDIAQSDALLIVK